MNRAERRAAGKRTTPAAIPFLDALLDQRVAGGCQDCDANQVMTAAGGVYVITVAHDDTCPWLRSRERNAR